MPRLFVGCKINPEVLEEAHRALAPLEVLSHVRWTRPHNAHLTLCFLGAVDSNRIPELLSALQTLATQHSPFEISLQGFEAFPKLSSARIGYVGVRAEPRLTALANAVEATMLQKRVLLERDSRPYVAHLTLFRSKRALPLAEAAQRLQATAPVLEPVRELILYESVSTPEGVRYQPLQVFELSAGELSAPTEAPATPQHKQLPPRPES